MFLILLSRLRGDKEMYRKLYHIDVLPQQFIDEYNIADELKNKRYGNN